MKKRIHYYSVDTKISLVSYDNDSVLIDRILLLKTKGKHKKFKNRETAEKFYRKNVKKICL